MNSYLHALNSIATALAQNQADVSDPNKPDDTQPDFSDLYDDDQQTQNTED